MRHLIFHILPVDTAAGRACWRWHLRQVHRHADLFDGRRVFAVATGLGLAPPDEVAALLPPRSTVLTAPNHPHLGETYTLPLLLARAFSVARGDAVMYAHAKGVTRVGHEWEAATRWWSLAMYRWLTDPAAVGLLDRFPTVGWLKHEGPVATFPDWSRWHYSGTFWWCRAAPLFTRDWWGVPPVRFGAEAYLSRLFPTERAAARVVLPNHLHQTPQGHGRLYTEPFWREQLGVPQGPDADSYDGSPHGS